MPDTLLHTMARKKSKLAPPLPPRDGLGASRVRVPETDAPLTAFEFLAEVIASQRHRHPEDTPDAVARRFADGEVVLRSGQPIAADRVLSPGTDVFFYRRPAPEREVPYRITTVFEDDDILVINKPPFLATMPRAAHITETATVRLRRATGNEELTPAHRLDLMTSGLLLFTKRRELRGPYQELFARREVRKQYTAIAPHRPISPTTWRHRIHKVTGDVAATLVPGTPNATTHVTQISLIDAPLSPSLATTYSTPEPLASYLLEPVTGKTHQLRIQMCAAGAPILGDPIYPTIHPFGTEDFSRPMLLTSVYLGFTDPLSGRGREFRAEAWLPGAGWRL
ncbi:23S rRNA pseudouridylate synthase [Corynebacterium sp. NML 120412]|nr:23S rRNA pseudouridylate synthase [Corynebacterium sp. NML 120412]PAT15952.1 23S rRNA pseudouridylate synthase [Corynebacterium sp. NML 120412]